MRERALLAGGHLRAGPDDGRFVVRAFLPAHPATVADACGRRTRERTIRVALVDDQALFRAGIRMLVSSQPDLEVVGEAGDGARASRSWRASGPTSC